ncbi:MAG: hypothetical protein ACNYPD_08335 [Candidatus Halichondribacter symbioticus]
MTDKAEKRAEVIQHLHMIQAIIKRMGDNSFLIKRWSIAVLAGVLVLMRYGQISESLILNFALCVPFLCFGYLDSYYLLKEREFRNVYNKIRKETETSFSMEPIHKKCSIWGTIFSKTIFPFYLAELLLIIFVIAITFCSSKT